MSTNIYGSDMISLPLWCCYDAYLYFGPQYDDNIWSWNWIVMMWVEGAASDNCAITGNIHTHGAGSTWSRYGFCSCTIYTGGTMESETNCLHVRSTWEIRACVCRGMRQCVGGGGWNELPPGDCRYGDITSYPTIPCYIISCGNSSMEKLKLHQNGRKNFDWQVSG